MTRQQTEGRSLYELGDGQWNIPALRELLEDIIPHHTTIEEFEVEHDFPTIGQRTMLLNARKVFYEGNNNTSLLVAIEDVTERRALEHEKDELLRQKDLLLQEMNHRINNSLQIIASILLLKAHTVQSEETRQHLHAAHERVMSVAAVQEQLHPTPFGGAGALVTIDKIEGTATEAQGSVKETVGKATGDTKLEWSGTADNDAALREPGRIDDIG